MYAYYMQDTSESKMIDHLHSALENNADETGIFITKMCLQQIILDEHSEKPQRKQGVIALASL